MTGGECDQKSFVNTDRHDEVDVASPPGGGLHPKN